MTRKYELSIATTYVENWGVFEALRELFQNAIDQGDWEYHYDPVAKELSIINHNDTLDTDSLLLGNTSKRNDGSKIGEFGEGYKLAVLALLRDGYEVTFYNGGANEIWKTRLVNSKKFNGYKIPTFFVEDVVEGESDDLVIVVKGIDYDDLQIP